MSAANKNTLTKAQLLDENEELRRRLEEAEQTIEAIRQGEVDAIVVAGRRGEQIYSLTGAEHTYRVIVETMNEAALAVDLDGTILFCNQQFCDLMRIPQCDVVGHGITEFAGESVRPALEAVMGEAQAGPVRRHLALRAEDGTAVPVLLSASLLQDGDHVSLCLVASDLTELEESAHSIRVLREQRQALAASEERYRRFFVEDLTGDFIATPEGKVVVCNPAFAEIYGYEAPQEAADRCDFSQLNREDWPDLVALLERHGKVHRHEVTHYSDGREIHIVANVVGQFNEAGELTGLQGYIFDDTERKLAELALQETNTRLEETNTRLEEQREDLMAANEELHCQQEELRVQAQELLETNERLRESEERLRFVLETSHIGAWDINLEDRTVIRSLEHARIFGYAELLPGWSYEKFLGHVQPEDRERVDASFRQALANQGRLDYECRIRRADGQVRWIWVAGQYRDNGVRRDRRMAGIVQDITERKEAENALRIKDMAIASSINAIAIADLDGRLTYVNAAFLKLWGYEDELEVLGKSVLDFWEEPQRAHEVVQTIQKRRAWMGELAAVRKDGTSMIVLLSANTVSNDAGIPLCMIASFLDITERKRAEEALREHQRQLTLAIDAGRLVPWEIDLVQGEVEHSAQLFRLFGLDPDEEFRSRQQWRSLIHEEDRPTILRSVEAAKTGQEYHLEYRIRHPDGTIHWHESHAVPLTDEAGRYVRLVGYARDITDRKQAEEALRQSEQRLALAASGTQIGMFEWDVATGETLWTEQGARLLGLRTTTTTTTTTTTISQSYHYHDWAERVHSEDRPRVEAELQRCKAACAPFEAEYRVIWPDGSVHWVANRGIFQYDSDGRCTHLLGILMDITERKQAEESLRELNATLESKVEQRTAELRHRARQLQKLALELSQTEDRERRRLAEILHDDLQQQLAAVKFHLGILAGRVRDDARVQSSAANLDGMLRNAIETSRSLSHELSPAVMYHGDMGEILEWLANQIRLKHGMVVHVDPLGEIDVESDALKVFLFKAVQEMLFNAVKHARVGEAKVRVRRRGRYICLCVSDRGRGFDPQDLRQTAGFGLMSIRERIGLLGGRMKIHSAKGVGSRFIITVPDGQVVDPSAGATLRGRPLDDLTAGESLASQEGGYGASPLRVLIADDHEVVRHGLASLLAEAADIELVGEAGNGREVVDMAYQLRPDVVIMDVAMPLMNGDEAARQIRRHLPQTRIVALSMYEEAGAIERMRRAGAEAYILKTAPSEELLAAVRGT